MDETDVPTAIIMNHSLSILKDKIQQLQTLVAVLFSPPPADPSSGTSVAIASMSSSAIQDIIMTSSSMLLNFQHMGLASTSGNPTTNPPRHDNNNNNSNIPHQNTGNALLSSRSLGQQGLIYPGASDHHQTVLEWYGSSNDDDQNFNNNSTTTCTTYGNKDQIRDEENMFPLALGSEKKDGKGGVSAPKNFDIIEFDAAELLAKYTHYCQVCGKGFKRDANLRMHMRAHGDQYKTSSALSNPMKKINNTNDLMGMNKSDFSTRLPKKYSCPQEGCRWNQRHAKFQPLKSMICVKNHYKRSHCPKMYVCKKCNRKQFSVLSDLRTHEKHCGDLKWQCSCGTTFSRKDKLMGHVSLFVGHTPLFMNSTSSSPTTNINNKKIESQLVSQVQLDSIVKMME
ncbi:hypothetical protein TIFTF001_045765 [Ficus carica]|uniref:C2H2-type domain-containing protein n=1 Tax=Ficus carica TaxID=3494 RepID=A0AA87Z3A0_FICCA|nr:hypothetical protein TIFTF001_045765 [Ficus carica]